ncbi:MAG: hypothetical protein QHJ82_16440, partial [Verrucomicrobiota bacterium]|nr:hypothetical protein [Verrucomicrobiota bacterium]
SCPARFFGRHGHRKPKKQSEYEIYGLGDILARRLSVAQTMKQAPPLKIALPFVLFCAIALTTWFFSRRPTALLAAALGLIMGALWMYGAMQARRETERLSKYAEPRRPAANHGLVISRAKRSLFSPPGYLLGTRDAFYWVTSRRTCNPGDQLALNDTDTLTLIAEYEGLEFDCVARMFGGLRLTLRPVGAPQSHLLLLDPEALANLLSVLSDRAEQTARPHPGAAPSTPEISPE